MKSSVGHEMREWIRRHGATAGQLNILVEDVKCQEATAINNKGLHAQVAFLMQHYTPKELRGLVRHEMEILKRYQMRTQSKVVPEHNVPLKSRRRKAK